MIYKGNQKNSRSPSSYRPVSLANSIYKVYACMLQQRLAHSIDHLLHTHQYGFRAGRFMSTPLFLPTLPLHGSESQVYSLAQITKIDSLHYKALRQIFKIKSHSFF